MEMWRRSLIMITVVLSLPAARAYAERVQFIFTGTITQSPPAYQAQGIELGDNFTATLAYEVLQPAVWGSDTTAVYQTPGNLFSLTVHPSGVTFSQPGVALRDARVSELHH